MSIREWHLLKLSPIPRSLSHGVAADAREVIRTETATLDTAAEPDPIADIEDKAESEENELVLDDC